MTDDATGLTLEEKEEIIEKVQRSTGMDEDVIGCWLCNYSTPPCQMLRGSCKSISICSSLESKYRGG